MISFVLFPQASEPQNFNISKMAYCGHKSTKTACKFVNKQSRKSSLFPPNFHMHWTGHGAPGKRQLIPHYTCELIGRLPGETWRPYWQRVGDSQIVGANKKAGERGKREVFFRSLAVAAPPPTPVGYPRAWNRLPYCCLRFLVTEPISFTYGYQLLY